MSQERKGRNYANGQIYMIESLEGNVRYIGSTVGKLYKRMCQHRKDHKLQTPSTASVVMKFPDARMLLIENWPCYSKEQLVAREAFHIRNSQCVNKNVMIPGFPNAKYHDNIEYVTKQDRCDVCKSYPGVGFKKHLISDHHQEAVANLL